MGVFSIFKNNDSVIEQKQAMDFVTSFNSNLLIKLEVKHG